MMTYASRLSAKVAAAALVTFSASCFLSSPAPRAEEAKSAAESLSLGPHTPEYGGPVGLGAMKNIIDGLKNGGVVVVFNPVPDGQINVYYLQRPGQGSQVDVWLDGVYQGSGSAPTIPPKSKIYGEGTLTDIKIWEGSGCCVETKLNGVPLTVCKASLCT